MSTTEITAEMLHRFAVEALEANELDKAITACRQALELQPRYPAVYICLGRIYRQKDELETAISFLEKAVSIQPKSAAALSLLGDSYYQQQDLGNAALYYERYLQLQPQNSNIAFKLGEVFQQLEQFDKAYSAYHMSLKYSPEPDITYFRRVLRMGFAISGSEKLLKQYIADHPRFVEPLKAWVKYRSQNTNIYHCCPPRTGSQWMKGILQDFRIYQYSGLSPLPLDIVKGLVQELGSTSAQSDSFAQLLPPNTIETGTFTISYDQFSNMVKPRHYRAFFVMRDPRDLVVSAYFANKKSHRVTGHIAKQREILNSLSQQEGLIHQIKSFTNVFNALRSWAVRHHEDPNTMVVRFEDLTGANQFNLFQKLFQHCDIQMPEEVLRELLEDNSFKKLSGGRTQGQEDSNSHYRKGTAGDWKNYFDDEVYQKFVEATGDLVSILGYL